MKKLEEIPKKEIFKAPEGFFENLPHQIRQRIDSEPDPNWLYRHKGVVVAFASFILLAVSLITFYSVRNTENGIQNQLSSISQEELVEYLENSNLSVVDIAENVNDEELFEGIIEDNLQFDADEFEEEILLDLEKYSDELL